MTRFLLTILIMLFFFAVSNGQTPAGRRSKKDSPFVLGTVEQIRSARLNETRTLNIYLPETYSRDSALLYPVIYLLDGSANEDFIHITGLVQFLTMIGAMPPSIIVGIANTDRKRDFTFPTTDKEDAADFPTSGGSSKFIAFIEHELQPFISRKYKTNNNRTIIGQSLGGLLATEIMLKKPLLFNNYILVSPSLWWDRESLLKKSAQLLAGLPQEKLQVYISVGIEGSQMEEDARVLAETLKNSEKPNLKVFYSHLTRENHLTILHNSVYEALKKINLKD